MSTENSAIAASAAPATVALPWDQFITPFATAIGKTVTDVTTALTPLVGDAGLEAIDLLKGDDVTVEDIQKVFHGVPTAKLKKAIRTHLKPTVQAALMGAAPVAASFGLLPSVPDDAAWLDALRVGGVLKVERSTVIAGLRAALAVRLDLYILPKKLVDLMERHAESLDQPVTKEFHELQTLLTKRDYSQIFQALEFNGARYATVARRNAFVDKLESMVWPGLIGFQQQLERWTEEWLRKSQNPAAFSMALASIGSGRPSPAGLLMQAPPTDALRDSAEAVVTKINRAFGGLGVQVAAAMGYDALQIKKSLENEQLPLLVGAVNKEQMLKTLGVDVGGDIVRLERNLIQYALAVMDLPNRTSGEQEVSYLSELQSLGTQIPWDKLASPARRSGPRTHSPLHGAEEQDEEDRSYRR